MGRKKRPESTPKKAPAPEEKAGQPLGLWDTRGRCWLGSEEGPNVYPAELADLARLAAAVMTERLGWLVRAIPFTGYGNLKDTVTPDMSAEEAMRRIEARAPNRPAAPDPDKP